MVNEETKRDVWALKRFSKFESTNATHPAMCDLKVYILISQNGTKKDNKWGEPEINLPDKPKCGRFASFRES